MADLRPLFKALNECIDELVELRETTALLEKQILEQVAPIPAATVVKKKKGGKGSKSQEVEKSPCCKSQEASDALQSPLVFPKEDLPE